MNKPVEIQSPELGYVNFVLTTSDEQGQPVTNTYKLIFDYRAIKRAEEALGIDLKDFSQWKNVKSSMTPVLVHAGLAKFHPAVTLDEVIDSLNPESQGKIQDAIFELLFPGVIEKIQKLKAEQDKAEGTASPNAESGATDAV
jgi:hypothetical protein